MSPEQLHRKPYNHRVDIFSMGLIFLELLVPFTTQSERLIKFNEAKKGVFPPSLAAEEKSLLSQMLHSDPDKRPETRDILHSQKFPWIREQSRVEHMWLDRSTSNKTILPHTIQDIIHEEELDN